MASRAGGTLTLSRPFTRRALLPAAREICGQARFNRPNFLPMTGKSVRAPRPRVVVRRALVAWEASGMRIKTKLLIGFALSGAGVALAGTSGIVPLLGVARAVGDNATARAEIQHSIVQAIVATSLAT